MRDDTLLPGKGAYTAVYSREPDGAWIVYVRGHRHEIHSFARSLRRARENIRDALSLWYDDAGSATIVDRVELEPALEEELAGWRQWQSSALTCSAVSNSSICRASASC